MESTVRRDNGDRPLFFRGLPRGASMYLAIDGKAVPPMPGVPAPPAPAGAAPGQKFRMQVKAGLHKVSATLIEQVRVTGTDDIYSIDKATGAIGTVSVIGPLQPTGAGDTPARRQVFICQPAQHGEEEAARAASSRIWRRTLRERSRRGAAVEALLGFYRRRAPPAVISSGSSRRGTRLINPRFLFRPSMSLGPSRDSFRSPT